jgi:uncharacterized repeat protein (TIGR02543 family)
VLLVVVASLGGCLQMLDPISADEYTVTYDPNGADGGAVPETRTSTAGDILVLAANHRGLTRTGFEFVGWNTVADGSGTSFPAGGSLAVDGDTTLFANWIELPTYIVSYDANGADAGSVPDSQWKTRGIALTLAANTGALTKGSYVFAGWNTAADGSGIDYPAGSELNVDADVTLHARWVAVPTFPISYQGTGADGGVPFPRIRSRLAQWRCSSPGNTGSLTRAGYTFTGWNTAADGSGTDYAAGASYTVDAAVTLYAQWTALPTWAIDLQDNGNAIAGADGGITFLPGGYAITNGNAIVDPVSGAIDISEGNGSIVMDMDPVEHARLELSNVDLSAGFGWGVYLHRIDVPNCNGYTLQFDPGLDFDAPPIIVRQWIDGAQRAPHVSVVAGDFDIDLYDPDGRGDRD